jgi:nitroreductase
MELQEAMRTNYACRYMRPDHIPDDVFLRAVDAARFAPNGGNRQAVRFIVVRDREKVAKLGELNTGPSLADLAVAREALADQERVVEQGDGKQAIAHWTGLRNPTKSFDDYEYQMTHFDEIPAVISVCADPTAIHPTDTNLDRPPIVWGASVYPMVQNFMLALREQGVGVVLTTQLVSAEPEVMKLLEIPEGMVTACAILAGYPKDDFFPKKLWRLPAEDILFADTYGQRMIDD